MNTKTALDIFLERFLNRYGVDFYTALPNPGIGGGKTDTERQAEKNFNPRMKSFLVDLMAQQIQDVDTESEAADNVLRMLGPLVTRDGNKVVIAPSWESNDDISDIEQFVDFKQEILDPVFTSTSNRGWWWRGNPATQEDEVSVQSEALSTPSGEMIETDEITATATTQASFDPVGNPPKAMMRKISVTDPTDLTGTTTMEIPYGSYHGPTTGPNGETRHVYRTYNGSYETWASDGAGGWKIITKEQKAPPDAESEYFDVSENLHIDSQGNRYPIFRATGLPDLQRNLGPAFKAATTFKPVITTLGDRKGYLNEDNEWVDIGDNTTGMSEYQQASIDATSRPYDEMTVAQQANVDQLRRNADATRARDLMTAQQYDYQNQLGAAQEQRLRFQAAQQARQATAQLGLQAAQQTQEDFLTFNEILNNPQSALSSMNWMRGAVAPTEENRFGEDPPMNRLADFNKSRDMYNSYLSQMYNQPMPEMPAFNPAANTAAGFMGTSMQNIMNQNTAAAQSIYDQELAKKNKIIANQNAALAAANNAGSNNSAVNTSADIQPTGSFYTANAQPNFATATPDIRFNPASELANPTATTRNNAAIAARIAAQRAAELERERNRNKITSALAQGFRY